MIERRLLGNSFPYNRPQKSTLRIWGVIDVAILDGDHHWLGQPQWAVLGSTLDEVQLLALCYGIEKKFK